MAETFRSAFLSVPKGQIEAAKACGMTTAQWLRYVVWPQIVPLALPGFTNNYLVLMKSTALVSIIGLQDVTYAALQAGRTTREPFIFLAAAMLIYLAFTIVSDWGLRRVERRYGLR
jgi:ABC-type arginine transport system permease subunit